MSKIINFDSSLKQWLSLSPVSHTSYLYFSIYNFKKIIEKKDKVARGTGDRDNQCCRVFTKKMDVENLKKVFLKPISDKMAQRVWIRPVPCPLSPTLPNHTMVAGR